MSALELRHNFVRLHLSDLFLPSDLQGLLLGFSARRQIELL